MNQLTVSLWGDEAFASILAQKNILDIVTIVARDTSPPLHYILLHFWMKLFGTSEIAIRAFPFVLFLLISLVVYRFAKETYGQKIANFAFILTILNPFLFLYAFEARMYMLLALTATASMWFFVTRRWVPYVIATTAALYTHHFSMFIVIVQGLYYVVTNRVAIRKNILDQCKQPFVQSLIAVILLYAPWLPALYGQTTMVAGDFWLPKPQISDLRFLYLHFIAGFTKLPLENLILWAAILILVLRGFHKKTDAILYLWLFLPAILTYFISQVGRPIFFDRYLIVSAAAIPMLLASQTKKIATPLLLFIIAGLVIVNIHVFQNPVKQPFRDVANFVHQAYGKDKEVVNYYTNALHYFELKHYDVNVKIYSPQGPLPFWVGTALIDQGDVAQELPKDPILLVMASGDIKRVLIPGYQAVRHKQFKDLSLIWFIKR